VNHVVIANQSNN